MQQHEPIIKNMPSEDVIKRYFEFIINAGIPERVAEAEQKVKMDEGMGEV
jgi:hypothetical protein